MGEWVFSVCAAAAVAAIIELLSPSDALGRYVGYACALFCLFAFLSPLCSALSSLSDVTAFSQTVINPKLPEYDIDAGALIDAEASRLLRERIEGVICDETGISELSVLTKEEFSPSGILSLVRVTVDSPSPGIYAVITLKKELLEKRLESLLMCNVEVVTNGAR